MMTEDKEKRVVLIKPGDILLIGNVGNVSDDDGEEINELNSIFNDFDIEVILFAEDITIDVKKADDSRAIALVEKLEQAGIVPRGTMIQAMAEEKDIPPDPKNYAMGERSVAYQGAVARFNTGEQRAQEIVELPSEIYYSNESGNSNDFTIAEDIERDGMQL